jgi:hypothetical protein
VESALLEQGKGFQLFFSKNNRGEMRNQELGDFSLQSS